MTDDATEAFFAEASSTYNNALDACYRSTPEWHRRILEPVDEFARSRLGIPMSFSRTLIHLAGGMQNLREHWRVEGGLCTCLETPQGYCPACLERYAAMGLSGKPVK